MQHTRKALLVFVATLASCSGNPPLEKRIGDRQCAFEKAALLALDEQSFDQDLTNGGGGWRGLAARQECELVAADLIAEYRSMHNVESPLLFWHEGQLRAFSGQYSQAISLLEKSYKPIQQDFGWNAYADATIAFLANDQQKTG